jgi:hypothetical protein
VRCENPQTGEVVEVLSETPELLVMQVTWTRPGHRAAAHVHPGMQERWHASGPALDDLRASAVLR